MNIAAHWLGTDGVVPQLCQGKYAAVLLLQIPQEPTRDQQEIIWELQYKCFDHDGNGMFALNNDWAQNGLYDRICACFGRPVFVEEI